MTKEIVEEGGLLLWALRVLIMKSNISFTAERLVLHEVFTWS